MDRRHFALAILASTLTACATVPTAQAPSPATVQILALNDFHGNLEPYSGEFRYQDETGEEQRGTLGGAAQMVATLQRLRQGREHSVTVAAGDLVGASPLASSYFLDEPAIGALNRIGLEIASVGNHEFDRGTVELTRLQQGGCEQHTVRTPCALEPFDGASFTYLAGNVVDQAGETLFPATTTRDFGALTIGFVGMTLKETAQLVSPAGTRGYSFLDEAETANRLAAELRASGADEVVVLLHQGAQTLPEYNVRGCPGMTGDILPILDALDPQIRLVVSGHTHKAYACQLPTAGGPDRLLTSAGRYGGFVTDIEASVDPVTRRCASLAARNVPVAQDAADLATAALVARYVKASEPVAARVVGTLTGDPAPDESGCVDNWREDLVADAQLAAARAAGADFAFINSGGVRTALEPAANGAVTFGQIFAMQPFGNSVSVVELSGAQIKAVLESQLCEEDGTLDFCFSHLTPSANMAYRIDASASAGHRIVGLTLNGQPLEPSRSYRVGINNFVAAGGDGFAGFTEGRPVGDGGVDVEALEGYLAGANVSVPTCGRVRFSGF